MEDIKLTPGETRALLVWWTESIARSAKARLSGDDIARQVARMAELAALLPKSEEEDRW
jgi:hypothetical protein